MGLPIVVGIGGRDLSPDRRAPGELETVRQFINTKDIDGNMEKLFSANALITWLNEHGLKVEATKATDNDLRLFLAVREGLRTLAMMNNGEHPRRTTLGELPKVIQTLALSFQVDASGRLTAVPNGNILEQAAGEIVLAAYRSMIDGTWVRLKTCSSDTCRWAFYDHSKNQTGKWCSMAVCGNRNKVKKYLSKGPRG